MGLHQPGEMLIPLEGKMQKEYRAKNLVKSLNLEVSFLSTLS